MNSRRVVFPQLFVIVIVLMTMRALQGPALFDLVFPSRFCTNHPELDLVGNTSEVFSVAFSPNGKYALTGSNDWTARLWDVQTGREIHAFTGHTGGVTSVMFSPDGNYILTASMDRTARLWNVKSGKEVRA